MSGDKLETVVVMKLFDSYWFENGVFTPNPSQKKPVADLEQQQQQHQQPQNGMIKTGMRKSHSDQLLSSSLDHQYSTNKIINTWSPKSVLPPHLQTILSGKEADHTFPDNIINIVKTQSHTAASCARKRKPRRTSSKSLSDLEFEELKGFMDLGFVFPDHEEEEGKDQYYYSRLVSIIPGLQKKIVHANEERISANISRPYLSEAWDHHHEIKININTMNPLMAMDYWRIPASGNELELKHHLRFWAHTVASTVR